MKFYLISFSHTQFALLDVVLINKLYSLSNQVTKIYRKQKLKAQQEKFEAKLENLLVFSNIDVTNFTGYSFLTPLHPGVSHNLHILKSPCLKIPIVQEKTSIFRKQPPFP